MKVEVDLTEYGVKAPKWYDPINPRVINASGGSGGSNDVELTLAEYEALSEEEKMNGTNYFITDIGNPKSLVNKVLFSGSVSANTDYTLSDSYKNYDFIKIDIGLNVTNNVYKSLILPKERYNEITTIFAQYDYAHASVSWASNYYTSCSFSFTNDTTIHTTNSDTTFTSGWTSNYIVITGYRYERVIVPNQMVNYSTVEQRIGTWIDGKPLYQKTITKSYDELTTYGVRKGFSLDVANAVLHNVEAYAYSPTYGTCFLGCKNYESNTSFSGYMECNMYYNLVIVGHSAGLSTLDENTHRPSLTATFQYTKTTD